MKLRITLAAILAGAFAAPGAFAQPGHDDHRPPPPPPPHDHMDVHADIHANVRVVPPPMGDHGRRDWKFEHPVVVSHTPFRGKPGERVVIRGQNFTKDTVVVWGGNPIPGAQVGDGEISFVVPPGAVNGTVYLRGGGLTTDLAVGDYEVAAADAAAAKAEDDALRAQAQADWQAQQIAKDKAARDAALEQQEAALEQSREQRREQYYADLQAKYDEQFLLDRNTVAELATHADRLARLERIQRLVADMNDAKLGVRVALDIRRENKRHEHRMTVLRAAFKGE